MQESGILLSIFIMFSVDTNCTWAGIRTSNPFEKPFKAKIDTLAF